MMGYVLEEYATFMESVKAYRAMSPVIFADIHPTVPGQTTGDHDGGKDKRGARSKKRAHARSDSSDDDFVKNDKPKKPKGGGKGKKQDPPKSSKAPCRYFNKGCCDQGRDCKFAHVSDAPGCDKRHARVDQHGRKDDRDSGRDRRR